MTSRNPLFLGNYDFIAQRAMYLVLAQFEGADPPIVNHISYGTVDIDPKHLAIHYAFNDDAALECANTSGLSERIRVATFDALTKYEYPAVALPEIYVGFVSEEAVTAEGGPWNYFR